MNFGAWDNAVHEDGEQQRRIATAKKADTTPASIDRENKTAEFKGTGKVPYITTLDNCSCVDFLRRKLPCKHIYRLSLELCGGDVTQGVNKNEYAEPPHDIFTLPVESQKILYDMCVSAIYHDKNTLEVERNEFSELLFTTGFCVQNVPTAEMVNAFPLPKMKHIIYMAHALSDNLPKKAAQRKAVVTFIENHYASVAAFIESYFIILELSEHADKLKRTIHRRFTNKFKRVVENHGGGVTSEHLEELFTQE